MKRLVTIRQNLDEWQFTQLAENLTNSRYVVSVYYRTINKFRSIEYKNYDDAEQFYEIVK